MTKGDYPVNRRRSDRTVDERNRQLPVEDGSGESGYSLYDDFFMAFSALIVVMQTILAVLVFARKVNDGSICATRVACEEGALLS